jgi:hypothetical protein
MTVRVRGGRREEGGGRREEGGGRRKEEVSSEFTFMSYVSVFRSPEGKTLHQTIP